MNLYIALTPFHLLLTLIHDDRNKDDTIVLIDDNSTLSAYESIDTFEDYHYINQSPTKNRAINRQLIIRTGNKKKLDNISKKHKYKNIYIFNDANPAAQYLAKKAKTISAPDVFYIEDGAAPYNNHKLTHSLINKIKRKTFYGIRHELISIIGTSTVVDASIYLYPDLARKENKIKPFSEFKITIDKDDKLDKFLNAITTEKNHKKEIAKILFLLPKINKDTKFISEKIENAALIINELALFPKIKRHPLDSVDTEVCNDLFNLPAHIPAELIPIIHKEIRVIFGVETTSLLSIRKLYPKLEIYNISEKPEITTFGKKLESVGIKTINYEEIPGKLSANESLN